MAAESSSSIEMFWMKKLDKSCGVFLKVLFFLLIFLFTFRVFLSTLLLKGFEIVKRWIDVGPTMNDKVWVWKGLKMVEKRVWKWIYKWWLCKIYKKNVYLVHTNWVFHKHQIMNVYLFLSSQSHNIYKQYFVCVFCEVRINWNIIIKFNKNNIWKKSGIFCVSSMDTKLAFNDKRFHSSM